MTEVCMVSVIDQFIHQISAVYYASAFQLFIIAEKRTYFLERFYVLQGSNDIVIKFCKLNRCALVSKLSTKNFAFRYQRKRKNTFLL